ncbi:MAG: hypothetical protein ACHREM_05055 [Polyangiales bacterium]
MPRYIDPVDEAFDRPAVSEIVAMLHRTPFAALTANRLALNPVLRTSFGTFDADLIRAERVIDLKVVATPKVEHVHQAVMYLVLARLLADLEPRLPKPRRIGIYYARQNFLWRPDDELHRGPAYDAAMRAFYDFVRNGTAA